MGKNYIGIRRSPPRRGPFCPTPWPPLNFLLLSPFLFSAAILARLLFHLETRILYDRPLSHCPSLEETLIGPTTDRFAGIANEIVTPTDFYRDSRSIRPSSSRIPSVGFIATPLKTMERTFLPRS